MAAEQSSLYGRLFRYGRLLVGHGWDTAAFLIATAYSIYTAVTPVELQQSVLRAVHIDPSYRLAVWGFGLALFFLYAGFRAWNEAESDGSHGDLARAQTALAREQLQDLLERRAAEKEAAVKSKIRRYLDGSEEDDPF
jgi:hypothetical protein